MDVRPTPRLLALDLDGSALRRDHRVAAEDHAAIVRLRAAGVHVTVATGRLHSGARRALRDLGICGRVACMNGSQFVDAQSGEGEHTCIGAHDLGRVRAVLRRHGLTTFLFARDGIHVCRTGEFYRKYLRSWSHQLVEHDNIFESRTWERSDAVLAVCGAGQSVAIARANADIHEATGGRYQVFSYASTRGPYHFFELRDFAYNKGSAVAALAAELGVTPEECVCLGDWFNDLSMFARLGRSFAMGQAPQVIKDAATDVCEARSREGGGVAEVARRVWGI